MANSPLSWSYERLLQLAPDASSLEQARRLFFAKRWQTLEGNGQYLWGEYETAYGHRSSAVVRLEPPLFRCSCKSPRRPCKHALALVLLFLNRNEVWTVKEELPDWAAKLLGNLSSSVPVTKPSSPDAVKQAKRIQLMDQGVGELDKWLQQLARLGLAHLANAPEEWETLAARMVDAKLGSIARRLRLCQPLFQQEDWVEEVTAEIGRLYLFVRAWQRKSTLEADQKRELLQVAGWNLRKEHILLEPGIQDNWLVLGLTSGEEEKLRYRRTWFRGEKTGKYALLLDFAFGNQGFEDQWVTGSVLKGTLAYYPGQPKIRAVFKTYQSSREPYEATAAYASLKEVQTNYAQALGASPWLLSFPALIDEVMPVYNQDEETFVLVDTEKAYLPMKPIAGNWKLLALSGGQPITCFGEYDGHSFLPISALANGRVILL
jgi:hypothetical protein